MVTSKNIKEAFDGHRGLPLESVHYDKGSIADLLRQETHRLAFEVDVELSDAVVQETEQRIRDLRKRLDEPNGSATEKSRVTERLLTLLGNNNTEADALSLIVSLRQAGYLAIDEKGAVTYHLDQK